MNKLRAKVKRNKGEVLDRFWNIGQKKARFVLKNTLKFKVIVPLDCHLGNFKDALEKSEDLESVTSLLECVDRMLDLLEDRRFILKELKRALDYEQEVFNGESFESNKEEEGTDG